MKLLSAERGVSHVVFIGVAVLLFGVVGTFLVVKSKAASCTSYVYSQGVNGSYCVGDIQRLLNYHINPYSPTLVADNNFGPKTKAAVIKVQGIFRIKQDGIVGPQTWRMICSPQVGPAIPPQFPLAAAREAGCNI